MASSNGEAGDAPLELRGTLQIETKDGKRLSFEVVGILEDPGEGRSYAVLMHDDPDQEGGNEEQFIVTDMDGNLLENDDLAQEILDEFLVFTEEASDDGGET